MSKETIEPVVRRNRLAVTFPKLKELNQNLPTTISTDSVASSGYNKEPIHKRNIMPAGAEGEQTVNRSKFYFDSKEPEADGRLTLKWVELCNKIGVIRVKLLKALKLS